ncbi:hypothetical protein MOQ_002976, partial [Trypanosoma cruzi marinkellei]
FFFFVPCVSYGRGDGPGHGTTSFCGEGRVVEKCGEGTRGGS